MPRVFPRFIAWLLLAAACLPRGFADDSVPSNPPREDASAQDVEAIVAWCREQGLEEESRLTRDWAAALPSRLLRIETAAESSRASGSAAAELNPQWQQRFGDLRREAAAARFAGVGEAAKAKDYSQAVARLNSALRADPSHAGARALLGDMLVDGQWLTPFAAKQHTQGKVWHDKFGWLPREHVEKYEAGQRFDRGAWVSAEEDARRHADIDSPWRVFTEHYAVATNHSLEAGVRLAGRLEALHRVWSTLFPAFVARSPGQLEKMFTAGPLLGPAGRRRHAVTYFKDKRDFQSGVAGKLPTNVETTGLYLPSARTAYFYHDESGDEATLIHEAVHQLFSERGRAAAAPGEREGFWAIEGIACYFESLQVHDDHATLGGVDAYRVQDARFYILRNGSYIPLAEFTQLGTADWQRRGAGKEIQRMYAQAAALCDFLMHADDGAHRDALVDYLARVYSGRPARLDQVTGIPFEQLDERFRDWLRIGDEGLEARALGDAATYLTLGGSRVTDEGLARLTGLDRIAWLDLHGTAVTDKGLEHVAKFQTLKRLDLSDTRVSDAGIDHIVPLKDLESLDLTGTAISDDGAARIRSALPRLEIKR